MRETQTLRYSEVRIDELLDTFGDAVTVAHTAVCESHVPSSDDWRSCVCDPLVTFPDGVDDWHECEDCLSLCRTVAPCFSWDHNSLRVCAVCAARINAEHPEGDE